MISQWKSAFLENMAAAFEKPGHQENEEENTQELYAQIGQLKVENEFKKSCRKLGYDYIYLNPADDGFVDIPDESEPLIPVIVSQ